MESLLYFLLLDKCNTTQKPCGDYTCVPASSWCNGYADCPDGSDEEKCSKSPICLYGECHFENHLKYYLLLYYTIYLSYNYEQYSIFVNASLSVCLLEGENRS